MNAINIITPNVPHFEEIYCNEIVEHDGRFFTKKGEEIPKWEFLNYYNTIISEAQKNPEMGAISLLFGLRQEFLKKALTIEVENELKKTTNKLRNVINQNSPKIIAELKSFTTTQKKNKSYIKMHGLIERYILQLEREETISAKAFSEAKFVEKMETLNVIRYYLQGLMSKNALMTSKNVNRGRKYTTESIVNMISDISGYVTEEKIADLFVKGVIYQDIINELEKRELISKDRIADCIIDRYNDNPFAGKKIIKLCEDGHIKFTQLFDLIKENGLTEEDVKNYFEVSKTTDLIINKDIGIQFLEQLLNLYSKEKRQEYLQTLHKFLNQYANKNEKWSEYIQVITDLSKMSDEDNRKQWEHILRENDTNYQIINLYQENKIDEKSLCEAFNNGIISFEDLQLAYEEDENTHIFAVSNKGMIDLQFIPENVLIDGMLRTDTNGGRLELETLYNSYIDGKLDITTFGNVYEQYKEYVKRKRNTDDSQDRYPLLPEIIQKENINVEKLKALYERGYLKYRDLFDFHNEGIIKKEEIVEIAGSADESYLDIFEKGKDIESIEGDSVPEIYQQNAVNSSTERTKKIATGETEFLNKGIRMAFFKEIGAKLTKKIIRRFCI